MRTHTLCATDPTDSKEFKNTVIFGRYFKIHDDCHATTCITGTQLPDISGPHSKSYGCHGVVLTVRSSGVPFAYYKIIMIFFRLLQFSIQQRFFSRDDSTKSHTFLATPVLHK